MGNSASQTEVTENLPPRIVTEKYHSPYLGGLSRASEKDADVVLPLASAAILGKWPTADTIIGYSKENYKDNVKYVNINPDNQFHNDVYQDKSNNCNQRN